MKNSMKMSEKITKIKNERYELLLMISDEIKNNGRIVANNIRDILSILDYDEKAVKKYIAIVQAEELIISLTKEITFAQNEEEIIAIRKKINYYINKIKNELKRRNISEASLNKYQEKVNYLRRDIAKYIRVLRRENNIIELDNLNRNYGSLSEDEKEKIKKLLNTEMRYNNRNLNSQPIVKKDKNIKVTQENISTSKEVTLENKSPQESFNIDYESIISIPSNENNHEELPSKNCRPTSTATRIVDSYDEVNSDDIDYLNIKIKSYDRQYNIQQPYSYNKSFLARVKNIIKNIPLYNQNKKIIKNMKQDSYKYYNGGDLVSYIAYLTKVNSIKHGLKSVFNRSYLYSDETRQLNNHEKCAEWLINYCKQNSIRLSFLNRTKVLS